MLRAQIVGRSILRTKDLQNRPKGIQSLVSAAYKARFNFLLSLHYQRICENSTLGGLDSQMISAKTSGSTT
jgi:hypothetical protein